MLFNPTIKFLQNRILEYDTPDAPDDLIVTYKDFIRVRDFLSYYPFNPVVFDQLLKLTIDLWTSDMRISKLSLLQGIKRYYLVYCGKQSDKSTPTGLTSENLPDETKELIFDLFKMTVEDPRFIIPSQADAAIDLANSLVIGMTLPDEKILWLCDHALVVKQALNRLLRYPYKSRIISEWVKNNYDNDNFRERRSEIMGRIMDYEPDFEIQKSTILDDFRYLNDVDIIKLKEYSIDEKGYFSSCTPWGDHTSTIRHNFKIYGAPFGRLPKELDRLDEVNSVLRFVYSDLDNIRMKLKIWAIAQSRIEKDTKVELFKKYYSEKTHLEIIRANEKIKSADLLRWILERMENTKSKSPVKTPKNPPKKDNANDSDYDMPF